MTPSMDDFTEKLISERPVIVRRRVLWGECDPAGVVYTPRFGDYFAVGRYWFLRAGLGFVDNPHPDRPGLGFPMRALSFDFRSFLAAEDVFDMTVRATAMSRRTFTIEVSATHLSGQVAFVATGTQMCLDQRTKSAITLPDHVVAALREHGLQADS